MDRSDFTAKLESNIPPFSSPGLADPRSGKDFDPKFYPKADGAPCPAPEGESRDDRIKCEFCAVYYQLNKLHARLTEMRAQAEQPRRQEREREVMREIETYLQIRDSLEDRYSPYGVIAEAIAQGGATIDIKFIFGDATELRRQRMQLISSTALLFFEKPDRVLPGEVL